MRRFSSASYLGLAVIVFFTAIWVACGGGSSNNGSTSVVTKFVFSPAIISLEPGQVVSVGATPYNSSGTIVSATVTYTSSDAKNAQISPGGSLCGGSWDPTFTLCTPTGQTGQFTISATANSATGTATAYIHQHVDAVVAHAPSATCTSMGKTLDPGITASAYTYLPAPDCTPGPSNNNLGCDITSTVGGFNFGVIDSSVASIDSTGKLTAGVPGTTKLYASVSSGSSVTTSTAVPYTTCLVDSIKLTVQSKPDTSFAVAKSGTTTLQADVLDTLGQSITPNLTYNSLQGAVGTVAGASSGGTATYSAKAPGYGSVVASCTPPNCNKNASAVFSNVVTSTVENSTTDTTVTANETNAYVTGVGAVQMYPVDTTKFTLGTVISLPYTPNSIAMSRDGSHIFLGGDTAGMVVTAASNSVQALSFPGKILAVSPNNSYVLFANTSGSTGTVYIMSASSLTIANAGGFSIPGVTSASFTPDGNTVYFAAGANLYRYRIIGDSGSTPTPLTLTGGGNPLPGSAADIKTSANGTILFSSITGSAQIVADETCNGFVGGQYVPAFYPLTPSSFTAPTAIAPLPDGSGLLAVDGTHLDNVTITNPNPLSAPFAGCPATGYATTPSTISLSSLGSGLKVNQLVMSHSGHYAAVLTGCTGGSCTPQVGIADLTKGTVTAVPLVDKGTVALTQIYSGDFMLDDSGLWVGADDAYIHFVDVTKLTDTQQVSVPIQGPSSGGTTNFVNPSLVVVQPK